MATNQANTTMIPCHTCRGSGSLWQQRRDNLEAGDDDVQRRRDNLEADDDDVVWQRRRERLEALRPRCQGAAKCGVNPLPRAAKGGNVDEFIQKVEEYSAQENIRLSEIMNMQGPSGNSLLHIAAGIENPDIIQALLMVIGPERVAEVNCRGDTALHFAVRAGRISTATLLLDRFGGQARADLDRANDAGNRALHEAVKNGNYDLTDLLLTRDLRYVYEENNESKCPLYLAVETGKLDILKRLMEAADGNQVQGMWPVLGAVMHRRLDMLTEMWDRKIELFDDVRHPDGGGTPLHLAAHENYVDGVKFLIQKFPSSALKYDWRGYLPIHVACEMGHLETIVEMLRHLPDPEELLTSRKCRNILHVAAKYGRASVVKYVLSDPELQKLINEKDKKGNTPLHVATSDGGPEVLLSLARDKRVDLKLVNHSLLTALDIVDKKMEYDAPLHQKLTRAILVSAGAPKSKDQIFARSRCSDRDPPWAPRDLNVLKGVAETRMVVATLIAAMTFAAGFSVPGGYNGSGPDAGIAMLLNKPMYSVFVMCDAVALFSSIIAVVILLWTQINDVHLMHHALRGSRVPLLTALAAMSVAFTTGVYVTVCKQTSLAIVTLVVGITAFIVIIFLYIALFIPLVTEIPFQAETPRAVTEIPSQAETPSQKSVMSC